MISYAPLLKTLEKKQISVIKLERMTGLTNFYTMIKNSKGCSDSINKICKVLNCRIEDVICLSEEKIELPKVKIVTPNKGSYGKRVDWNKVNDLVQQKYASLEDFALSNGKSRSNYRGMGIKGSGLKQETLNFLCNALGCNEDDILLKEGNGKLKSLISIDWSRVSKMISEKGMSEHQFSLSLKMSDSWFCALKKHKTSERATAMKLCRALGCELKDIELEVSDEV